MATIGSLVVDLQAETAAFRRDLGRARRDVKRFADRTTRQLTTVNRGFTALAAGAKAFVGVFAVSTAVRGIDRMFQSVSELADTSAKLGVAAEELQRLRFAAEQTGVSAQTLDMGLQRFGRRIGEVAAGTGVLRDVFRQYGIEVTDSTGRLRSQADILGEFADVIQGAESNFEKLRISQLGFDSEGVALVNTLGKGSAALQELMDQAVVTSNALVARGDEINKQWRELTTTIGVTLRSAVLGTITLLEDMWIAAMPGTFRIGTDIESLETQLAGLRQEAAQVREEMGALGEPGPQMMPGRQGLLNTLQDELTKLDLQSFEVQQRLQRLRRESGDVGVGGTDTTARDRIAGVTEELRFQAEQLARTAEVQRVYTEARRAGVEIDSAAGREIRNLVERLQEAEREQAATVVSIEHLVEAEREYQESVARAARETEDGMRTIRSSSERALGGMARDLLDGENAMDSLANAARSTVNAIISEFLRLAVVRPIIGGIFGGLGGVTGIGATSATQATAAAGTGALFQHGGSFIADGPGGTDAIAQRINVTKGERVTVETPAQQRAGSGDGVVINQTFNITGNDAGNFATVQRLMREMESRTLATIRQMVNAGILARGALG